MRGVVKGKRWLLLTRWMNLDSQKRQQLNELFALNRRVMKAYLLIWNDLSTRNSGLSFFFHSFSSRKQRGSRSRKL
jgi:hypothetical protein